MAMNHFDLSAILANPEFSAMLWTGIRFTVLVFVGSWMLGMALATVLLTIRLTHSKIAQHFVAGYITYHRNVPTLVQLMLWYFGISNLLPDDLQAWLADHSGEAFFAVIA